MSDALSPLAIDTDNWRSRWLQLPRGEALHRVSSIAWEGGEMIAGQGVAVCGRKGRLRMPGIFSRMAARRCPKCCAALGIPEGEGAPYNETEIEERAKHV